MTRWFPIALLVGIFTEAQAKTDFSVTIYEEWTLAFVDGVERLPPATTAGIGMTNGINPRLGWYTELSVSTLNTEFTPAPRLIGGLTFFLTKRWSLTPVALFQFNPPYGDTPASYFVGGGANLMVAVTDEIFIGLVVGGSVTLGADELAPTLTIAPNLSFLLPR